VVDDPRPHAQRAAAAELRTARFMAALGGLSATIFAVLSLGWLGTEAGPEPLFAAAACAGLAGLYALMWLFAARLSLASVATVAVLATIGVAAVVGVAGASGLRAPALAFVPVLLGAAASVIPARTTLLLAALHAFTLGALAAVAARGMLEPAAPVQAWATAFGGQLALLAVGTVIGLLTRRRLDRSMARARSREQRFAGLLAVAADWYWETDADLRYTHIERPPGASPNPVLERYVGRAPWEIGDFGLDAEAMDAHRSDLELRRPFTDLRLQRTGADARPTWLSLSGRPRHDARGVFLGYWGVARDITVQHLAEVERHASELRYRELFARSPSPLVLHRDGRVIDANVAALALFGAWVPEDFIGRPLLDFYEEEDGSRELAARRLARLARVPIGEAAPPQQFAMHTTAGRRLTVQVTSVKVEAEGAAAVLSIYRDETERQRAEGARARSEALLAHVVATSPNFITLTDLATDRFVMANDAFLILAGHARDQAIGRTAAELQLWVSEEEHARFMSDVLAHDGVRDRTVRFRRRDGGEVVLLVSAARFVMEGRDYLVLNGRDITDSERTRLEREAILANASIGIAMTRQRVFQLANPAFEEMFGWPPGELVGQPGAVTSVDLAAYVEMGRLVGGPLSRGEAVEFERTMKRRDGSTFLCRLLAKPIDPTHPAHGGTIWIAEDVTEKRAVEQALARARDEAEAANRAKSAFLANTSHEIRTPLNGLVGLARLARQPSVDDARRERYLAQIDESAQALAGVISDILDLSKIEAGKLSLEQTDFDLHALLESIEHGYAALADARALALTMHASGEVPRRVRGDPARLRQILSNYLSNALKFTEAGFVRLHVRAREAPVIRFEVEDSGPGIAQEVQARLFQPFVQADVSTTRRFGGTGLGLSICRELAQLMGGRVGVTSQTGRGSRFWAELPLPASDREAPGSAFVPLQEAPTERLLGLEVLVVEDNPVNMMIATTMLRQWGVSVSEVGNGAEAVAAVTERADAGRPYDLVLMDVQMPVQGGHDATRQLRQRFAPDVLPIIALTAAALTSERDDALAAGMNDFLTKPLDTQRLLDVLLRWAGRRTTNGPTSSAAATPPVSTS
jgi:PAS domain S-box-containing protein